MSLNTLEFNTAMTQELDKAVVQKAVTGFLSDNTLRAKFVGAKTVLIPEMGMSGLGDYDRDTGFVRGSISVSNRSYTLSQDRGRSFQLDREDEDETGIAGLAGEVLGEFVRTKVVPEMDAYVISKIAGYAVTKEQVVTGDIDEPYALFSTAVKAAQDAIGFDEELVAFVDSDMLHALQESDEVARHIDVSAFQKGDVSFQVKTLDGITLLPVEKSRMKTAYTFYDGSSEGETEGGFVPTVTAADIGLIVMPRRAASLVKKTEKMRTFAPDQNPSADAYQLDYRLYYDVFIKNSLSSGIQVFLYEEEEDDEE